MEMLDEDVLTEEDIEEFLQQTLQNMTKEEIMEHLEKMETRKTAPFLFGSGDTFEERLDDFIRRFRTTITTIADRIRRIINVIRGTGSGNATTESPNAGP